ncbi:MAG: helix-turn-helix transcriptional regulator [Porphyromonas sp.]|nr:helix-turn-helix transcriptional regulator [Porphyromonas sp.]
MEIKDRIATIIEQEGISQVEFSKATGIKTSTLSHVLTGRNNASNEVLTKIFAAYPAYREKWIIDGIEPMLYSDEELQEREANKTLFSSTTTANNEMSSTQTSQRAEPTLHKASTLSFSNVPPVHNRSKVTKIIIYFDDNTFQTFIPSDE